MKKYLFIGLLVFLQSSFAAELIEAASSSTHVLLATSEQGLVINIRGLDRESPTIHVNDKAIEWSMVSHGPTVSTGHISLPEQGSLIVINGVSLIWKN